MFTQNDLRKLKSISLDQFPRSNFLIMFVGVVIAPLLLFIIGGRDSRIQSQPGIFWYLLAIALFLLTGIGIGFLMFKGASSVAKGLSIGPNVE